MRNYRFWSYLSSLPSARRAWLGVGLIGLVALGGWAQAAAQQERSAFVIEQIRSHNASLSAGLRTDKYSRMAESTLNFLRATNYLYWADFGHSAKLAPFGGLRETRVWLQGDAHVENIGAIENSAGTVVYDLDDFDEVVVADYQLDLWRLATSLILLVRENGGFSPGDEAVLIDTLSTSYLNTLASYRDNSLELTHTYTADNTPSPLSDFLTDTAQKASRVRMLDKLTTKAGGRRVFDFYNPELVPVPANVAQALATALSAYLSTLSGSLQKLPRYFKVKSVAQRYRGGMGSLGQARYYLLIEGPTASEDDDHILDVKEQGEPAGWKYMDPLLRDELLLLCGGNHATRSAVGSRALGYRVDDHLGTLTLFGDTFSVRERTPARGTFDVRELSSLVRATRLAEVWGAVLATAHARADRDSAKGLIATDFEREVLARVGPNKDGFRARVREIAIGYATQVESDYRVFVNTLTSVHVGIQPSGGHGQAPGRSAR